VNGFVRQLAALAALWALCELLLPRRQQMVRLAVSLMVMAALVLSLGRFLGQAQQTDWPVFAQVQPARTVNGYQRIALTGYANQIEAACVRQARKAGYEAGAAVYLRQDGGVERIQLSLRRGEKPLLMEETALTEALAQWLALPQASISWQRMPEEEVP